jgi:hypothetical protein
MRTIRAEEERSARGELRKAEFRRAKALHEESSRRSGALSLGTDEEGRQAPCRTTGRSWQGRAGRR